MEADGARVSMDGKGRWMDNVFIERLWRSLKYEELRLWSYGTLAEGTSRTGKWMDFYHHRRKHQALDFEGPWKLYRPEPTGEDRKILTNHKSPPSRGGRRSRRPKKASPFQGPLPILKLTCLRQLQ